MMYLRYQEAHEQVFERGDEDAKAIVRCVNSVMIRDNLLSTRPLFPFNMHYFYHSLIYLIGRHLGKTLRSGLDNLDKINGVNYPHLANPDWSRYDFVRDGLADEYIGEVCKASTAFGSSFDVTFACIIASESIERNWLSAMQRQERVVEDHDDFEQWLAHFNK
jgi:hypothetical protein